MEYYYTTVCEISTTVYYNVQSQDQNGKNSNMYEESFSLILTLCLAYSARSGDGFKCRSRSPSLKPLRLFGDNECSYQGCSQVKAW